MLVWSWWHNGEPMRLGQTDPSGLNGEVVYRVQVPPRSRRVVLHWDKLAPYWGWAVPQSESEWPPSPPDTSAHLVVTWKPHLCPKGLMFDVSKLGVQNVHVGQREMRPSVHEVNKLCGFLCPGSVAAQTADPKECTVSCGFLFYMLRGITKFLLFSLLGLIFWVPVLKQN